MGNLYEKLVKYGKGNVYPFHMPGHKRNVEKFHMENPYELDITEIDGFDNLHQQQGVLKELTRRIEGCYGAEESIILINGSTCGLLIGITSALRHGDKIIMARNCHMAVYHAVLLNNLIPVYLYPQDVNFMGINGPILPDDVDKELNENPDAKLVVITSPTYEGIISDVKEIAKIVHEHGAALLVDEAHGAHFGFHPWFPENSIKNGADVVIQSLHKTLPAFTQTAVLHSQGNRISKEKIKLFSSVYQTSSPSYLLMASIDRCVDFLETCVSQFEGYAKQLKKFYSKCGDLQYMYVVTEGARNRQENDRLPSIQKDPSKILISGSYAGLTGKDLYDKLQKEYHLQMEMASCDYVIAMTSVCDSDEGYERLWKALQALDLQAGKEMKTATKYKGFQKNMKTDNLRRTISQAWMRLIPALPMRYTPYKVQGMNMQQVEIPNANGRIIGEYLYLYPPGIPLAVPGEVITGELINLLYEHQKMGFQITGGADKNLSKLQVVK